MTEGRVSGERAGALLQLEALLKTPFFCLNNVNLGWPVLLRCRPAGIVNALVSAAARPALAISARAGQPQSLDGKEKLGCERLGRPPAIVTSSRFAALLSEHEAA